MYYGRGSDIPRDGVVGTAYILGITQCFSWVIDVSKKKAKPDMVPQLKDNQYLSTSR